MLNEATEQPNYKMYGKQQQWLHTFLTLVGEQSFPLPVLLSGAEPSPPNAQMAENTPQPV